MKKKKKEQKTFITEALRLATLVQVLLITVAVN